MSVAEEVRRVLLEHPEIIAEAIEARPEVLYRALARLTPWQNLATKEDVRSLREEMQKIEEKMATKDDIKDLEARMATREDVRRLEEQVGEVRKVMATKDDLKAFATREDVRRLEEQLDEVRRVMATKEDLKGLATKEELKALEERMATKEDLKALATREELRGLEERMATKRDVEELWRAINRLERKLDALGARWGVISEEAFREGMRAMLREAGWSVSKEVLYDREGYVYGTPSEVDYDVVVRDGRLIIVEITSSLKRSDLPTIVKKRELYERARGAKVAAVYVVTPYIDDRYPERVKAMAKDLGLEVVYPAPPQE
ncbi:PD-(D/E)XK nuclease family protein [Pyrobaculum neutrophilum]|uniref:DUF3782 domain-containing protein n=1 Tax=Pyrobaculum neutrophilum (strain DSM 2338 / JCM 9278 / NBRC 100436 / V24Sta) TaxID=444157 RepID=B1YDY9_PYRNV|nr:DUF3782 domain-containing protein [Pyrobaculum neutrophilum]ACB40002.1 Protein of unknown function DUF1626 [Pyrobaculum neutrophilum V24Sta]